MRLASIVTVSAILVCGFSNTSYSQNRCDALRPVISSGMAMKITKMAVQRALTVQFIFTNSTNGASYIKSAQWGENGKAFLGSGTQIFTPEAVGIETTQGTPGSSCVNNPSCYQDLNRFSSIDAQGSMRFAYKFNSMTPMSQNDEISFTVIMVARFARSTDQDGEAGPPRLLRFSFNSIPLNC